MPEKPELIVWTDGGWRCEYWHIERTDSAGELRLYHGDSVLRSVAVNGDSNGWATAKEWRVTVLEDTIPAS